MPYQKLIFWFSHSSSDFHSAPPTGTFWALTQTITFQGLSVINIFGPSCIKGMLWRCTWKKQNERQMSFSLHVISWSAKFHLRLFIKISFCSSAGGSKPCHSSHCDSMNFYFLFSVFVLFVSPEPFCETHLLGHSSKHLRNMLSKTEYLGKLFLPW